MHTQKAAGAPLCIQKGRVKDKQDSIVRRSGGVLLFHFRIVGSGKKKQMEGRINGIGNILSALCFKTKLLLLCLGDEMTGCI